MTTLSSQQSQYIEDRLSRSEWKYIGISIHNNLETELPTFFIRFTFLDDSVLSMFQSQNIQVHEDLRIWIDSNTNNEKKLVCEFRVFVHTTFEFGHSEMYLDQVFNAFKNDTYSMAYTFLRNRKVYVEFLLTGYEYFNGTLFDNNRLCVIHGVSEEDTNISDMKVTIELPLRSNIKTIQQL